MLLPLQNMNDLLKYVLVIALSIATGACKTNHSLQAINCKAAPKVIGPYSHAIRYGNMIFCSGQIGLLPETGILAGDSVVPQTQQALNNIKVILEDAGSDLSHVVKVTLFLKDLNDYAKVNDVYKGYFQDIKPARSAVQVAGLPKGALIEIECIATTKR